MLDEYNAGWTARINNISLDVDWPRMRKIGWHNANGTKYNGGP